MICFLRTTHVQYLEVGLLSKIPLLLYNNLTCVNEKFKANGLFLIQVMDRYWSTQPCIHPRLGLGWVCTECRIGLRPGVYLVVDFGIRVGDTITLWTLQTGVSPRQGARRRRVWLRLKTQEKYPQRHVQPRP